MSDLISDTHTAIWYFSNSSELSAPARQAINNAVGNGNVILLPTVSIVEIVYLIEKNRLVPQTLARLIQALNLPNSSFITQDLTAAVALALQHIPRSIVPDMPDRIISATALHLNLPLVTKDGSIRKLNNIQTIW